MEITCVRLPSPNPLTYVKHRGCMFCTPSLQIADPSALLSLLTNEFKVLQTAGVHLLLTLCKKKKKKKSTFPVLSFILSDLE